MPEPVSTDRAFAAPPWSMDLGLLVARVGFGLTMLIAHGTGKLTRLLGDSPSFSDPLGLGGVPTLILAVVAELVCAGLIALGLFTRVATLPLIATMSTAFFIAHADDPFPRSERAFLFLIAFVALLFTGPGRWSLDHLIFGRRETPPS